MGFIDLLAQKTGLFKSKKRQIDIKDEAFRRKVEYANREISRLDTMIMVYRRKLMDLNPAAPDRHQKLKELKWMLMELQARAGQVQALVEELKEDHVDFISTVEGLIDQFEEMFPDFTETIPGKDNIK